MHYHIHRSYSSRFGCLRILLHIQYQSIGLAQILLDRELCLLDLESILPDRGHYRPDLELCLLDLELILPYLARSLLVLGLTFPGLVQGSIDCFQFLQHQGCVPMMDAK